MAAGPSAPAPPRHPHGSTRSGLASPPPARHAAPRSPLVHLPAASLFAVLALLLTWPLASDLFTQVPGTGPDDNVVFLWNYSWMRHALSQGLAGGFHTPLIFSPGGVDLVLHTHTALNAFIGATVLGALPPAAALNVMLLASCALNGFLSYLLAYRATGHLAAAVIAGLFFAASPAMTNHFFGHFNFYSAWVLLLFVLTWLKALERPSHVSAVLAGMSLAAVAYTDYYYFIYASVFALCVAVHRWCGSAMVLAPARARGRLDRVLVGVTMTFATVAVVIAITGGIVIESPIRISLTTGTNVRALAAAAAVWWLWRRWPLSIGARWPRLLPYGEMRAAALTAVVALLLMSPILVAAFDSWRQGDYVSQAYMWRSSPTGVDPATVALGNPYHHIWGPLVMRLYAATGMNAFDGPLWMGVIPLVLWATRRAWLEARDSRLWLFVLVVFLFWALGPFFIVLGVNTGLPLPQFLLRFVPVVSNARIPGHAVIFVYLAVAILLSQAIAGSRLRHPAAIAALAVYLILDFAAFPFPMHRLVVPALYQQLAALPAGAVVEVPLGLRDGFGEEGRFDANVLFYQTVHGKPLSGGYIARLPPSVRSRMHESPVLDPLLRLSGGQPLRAPLPSGRDAGIALRQQGVKYVVVNHQIAPAEAVAFVQTWPIRSIGRSGDHELYELD